MYRFAALLLLLFAPTLSVHAQNVTGYEVMDDPLLFLLREPAVHKDLGLSASQKERLVSINESLDGLFLSSRNNKNKAEVEQNTKKVMGKSREAVSTILSQQQQDRLRQISYRLKGMPFILLPDAVAKLQLTSTQKTTIEKIIAETKETVSKHSSREFQGAKAYEEAQRTIMAARKREQEEIMAALNATQKRQVATLVGKSFDPSTLYRVAFRAPELVDSGQWVNTESLNWDDLKGKVVALHFFAFG